MNKIWYALCFLLSTCFGVSSEAVINFAEFEKSIYSQNGEDGVVEEIFRLIGTDSKYYVEFGAYDGFLCSNTRYLREHQGWEGLLLDGGFENLAIDLYQEFITAENINDLFEKYQVPENVDFLSIDIDYNDFYVWHALDSKYRPRLIVVEYNATHLPDEDKVVEYLPDFIADGTNYFGASIQAFYNLGRSKGYSLVYADAKGVNLFFIRDDLIEGIDGSIYGINDVFEIYCYPKYGVGPNGGHQADTLERDYTSSKKLLNREEITK